MTAATANNNSTAVRRSRAGVDDPVMVFVPYDIVPPSYFQKPSATALRLVLVVLERMSPTLTDVVVGESACEV